MLRYSAIHDERQAAKLLNDLREVRLRHDGPHDLEYLRLQYASRSRLEGNCRETCTLYIGFSNTDLLYQHPRLGGLMTGPDWGSLSPLFHVLHIVGFRFYHVEGWVTMQDGNVGRVVYELGLSTPDMTMLVAEAGRAAPWGVTRFADRSYWAGRPGGCDGCIMIYTVLTPAATETEIRKAFDVNVHCVSQLWHSCETYGEIMPSAAPDLVAWDHPAAQK